MRVHGLIIDPQWDFCWPGLAALGVDLQSKEWLAIEPLLRMAFGPLLDDIINPGKLYVPGAYEDMQRLAGMVNRLRSKIDDIHVTLDSHRKVDQAHPIWWKNVADGTRPNPFTILGLVANAVMEMLPQPDGSLQPGTNEFTTYMASYMVKGGPTGTGSRGYLEALEQGKRYPHVVWPEHCLIGTMGHMVMPLLMGAFLQWADGFATVDYVTKGSNFTTEHYSGVQAEVPDPDDPSTQVNTTLITTLEEADIIFLAGEASTHCLPNTVRDVINNFRDPKYAKKMVLLTDATSPVPGFESYYDDFFQWATSKGMGTATTDTFLS